MPHLIVSGACPETIASGIAPPETSGVNNGRNEMRRTTRSIATAYTGRNVDNGIVPNLPELVQRTWTGKATDETVRKWLRSLGLRHASVSVYKSVDWGPFRDSRREVVV